MKKTTAELQAELEELLYWFESDQSDIDEAVKKYEQGLKLVSELESRIKDAKNTVTKLKDSFEKEV